MPRQSPFFILSCITLLWALSACEVIEHRDKILPPDWQAEFAVPIANTQFNLRDLLEAIDTGDFLERDSNGALSLVYETDLFEVSGKEVMVLPNLPVPMFDTAQEVPYPLSGLQEIWLKDGQLGYRFESQENESVRVKLRFASAQRNGASFEREIEVAGTGTHQGSFDLREYTLFLTDGRLKFSYEATLAATGQPVSLANFRYELNAIDPRYMEGYMGQTGISLSPDVLQFSLFDSSDILAHVRLEDPRLTLEIDNSFGVPVQLQAETMKFHTPNGDIPLGYAPLDEGLVLNYPSLDEVGTAYQTAIALNKDNSNLVDIMASAPTGLEYELSGMLHPSGDNKEYGFLSENSKFKAHLSVELPVFGSLHPYEFGQTLTVPTENLDQIEHASLKLLLENGFPLEVGLQVYLLNHQGESIDSVFTGIQTLMKAASVDAEGRVRNPEPHELSADLSPSQMDLLQEGGQVRIQFRLSTTQSGQVPVRFYEDYSVGLRMGIKAGL